MSNNSKKTALVWKYFSVDLKNQSIAICLLCPQMPAKNYENSRIPRGGKTTNSGYGTSNQKAHLKSYHSKEYNELISAEENKKQKTEMKNQEELQSKFVSIPEFFKLKEPLPKTSEKWKMITKDIALIIFQDNLPYSIVEKLGFKIFMHNYEKRYEIPSRKYFSKTIIPEMYNKTKDLLADSFKLNVIKAALTTDIWTSNANESFLSLTIHYISENFERHNMFLEIADFPSPHTYDRILATISYIIKKFKLNDEQIFMILHDSASNMHKAFSHNQFYSVNCSNHIMQLAINDSIDENINIKNLIEKIKKIVAHFNRSSKSWQKLKETEAILGIDKKKMISYSVTRWNGQFLMLERCD